MQLKIIIHKRRQPSTLVNYTVSFTKKYHPFLLPLTIHLYLKTHILIKPEYG